MKQAWLARLDGSNEKVVIVVGDESLEARDYVILMATAYFQSSRSNPVDDTEVDAEPVALILDVDTSTR